MSSWALWTSSRSYYTAIVLMYIHCSSPSPRQQYRCVVGVCARPVHLFQRAFHRWSVYILVSIMNELSFLFYIHFPYALLSTFPSEEQKHVYWLCTARILRCPAVSFTEKPWARSTPNVNRLYTVATDRVYSLGWSLERDAILTLTGCIL